MTRDVAYLDASALVKLVAAESGTSSLRRWVRSRPLRASCALVRTEVPRALRRLGLPALSLARDAIGDVDLIPLDDEVLDAAALLDPMSLRTLDAIHLAAARSLGDDLDVVVTYDRRMVEAARLLGVPTASPV